MSNLQFAKDLYGHFARGDVASFLAGCDSAIEWYQAEGNPYQMDGAAWHGPQTIVEKLFVPMGRDWEAFSVTVDNLHDAGDHVAMEGRYTGTYRPTGKRFDSQVCHILHFQNGKLIRFQQYCDTAQLQRVMDQSMSARAVTRS